VRPGRDNIAAPDLPDDLVWIGERPDSMPALTAAGPAIVHFFDFAQLNSVRTIPYLSEWERRYREAGLRVIGVQATEREQRHAGYRQRRGAAAPVGRGPDH